MYLCLCRFLKVVSLVVVFHGYIAKEGVLIVNTKQHCCDLFIFQIESNNIVTELICLYFKLS